jgi:hypothetical protein
LILQSARTPVWKSPKERHLKLERVLVLLGMAAPLFGQYAGPAILTRGEAPSAMSLPDIYFRPFVEVTGIYDSGLAGVAVKPNGELGDTSAFGLMLGWGVSGTHSWRHTKVGLDYRGSTTHYFKKTNYDSIDQSLLLGVTHQLSRRATLSLRESAGMFSRDFGLISLPQTVPFDPTTTYVPTTDYFDNRTIYLTSQADLSYQKTARLSFDMGGGVFITRRRSTSLYGTIGEYAHGDMVYRVSRQMTMGLDYGYQHFEFTRIFGGTDFHVAQLIFARQLTRLWELSGAVGGGRMETQFVESVPIAPAIAALLGITESSEVVHDVRWVPNFSGRLSRTFHRGVAFAAVGHTITPGNGLFLTSAATTTFVGYNYTGLRRWSMAAELGYIRSKSVGNIRGVYSSESGTVTASRQILHSIHFVAAYSARRYDSPTFTRYHRLIHSARVGFGWSPGDVPLRIW